MGSYTKFITVLTGSVYVRYDILNRRLSDVLLTGKYCISIVTDYMVFLKS